MDEKKSAHVMVRMELEVRERLQLMADATHDTPAGLCYKAAIALIEAYERNGYFTSPLRMADPAEAAREFVLNEPTAPPASKKTSEGARRPRATAALSASKPLPDAGTVSA